jgi:hypothetical protein
MDFETFHSTIIKHSEDLYAQRKVLPMACFALLPDNKIIALLKDMTNEEEKREALQMYAAILLATDAKMYSITSEYYVYQAKHDEKIIPASQHPDRKEGLGVFTVDKYDKTLIYSVEIENEQIRHGKSAEGEKLAGRFSALFHLFDELSGEKREFFIRLLKAALPHLQKCSWYVEISESEFLNTKMQ